MNTQAKNILVSVAFCLGGGLLAVNAISTSFAANTDSMSSEPVFVRTVATDRFASTANFCKALTGAQEVGTDGVSAEFSAALSDAIQSNGGDAKRTFLSIPHKCPPMA